MLCLQSLPPGSHQYKFLVDGKWQHREDLDTVPDGIGGVNNQVVVAGTFRALSSLVSKLNAPFSWIPITPCCLCTTVHLRVFAPPNEGGLHVRLQGLRPVDKGSNGSMKSKACKEVLVRLASIGATQAFSDHLSLCSPLKKQFEKFVAEISSVVPTAFRCKCTYQDHMRADFASSGRSYHLRLVCPVASMQDEEVRSRC
jgi:hypothetical protein